MFSRHRQPGAFFSVTATSRVLSNPPFGLAARFPKKTGAHLTKAEYNSGDFAFDFPET